MINNLMDKVGAKSRRHILNLGLSKQLRDIKDLLQHAWVTGHVIEDK